MEEKRYFEGDVVASLYAKTQPRPPAELISRVMEFLEKEDLGELELAVDAGCGSGQNTAVMAKYFQRVIAVDISASQIDQAIQMNSRLNHVNFQVGSAERLPVKDASVQLITACGAAHWFQLDKFLEECRGALVDNGIIALYCHKLFSLHFKLDRSKDDQLNEILTELCQEKLKEYWPPEIELCQNEYRSIELPGFRDVTREYNIYDDADVPLSTVLGCIRSWPAYQTYVKTRGEDAGEELLSQFRKRILGVLGKPEDAESTYISWINNYFLVVGRK